MVGASPLRPGIGPGFVERLSVASRITITGADGRDMEMHPRPVDVMVVRPVGESYTGRDSQLDAAVRELLAALPGRR